MGDSSWICVEDGLIAPIGSHSSIPASVYTSITTKTNKKEAIVKDSLDTEGRNETIGVPARIAAPLPTTFANPKDLVTHVVGSTKPSPWGVYMQKVNKANARGSVVRMNRQQHASTMKPAIAASRTENAFYLGGLRIHHTSSNMSPRSFLHEFPRPQLTQSHDAFRVPSDPRLQRYHESVVHGDSKMNRNGNGNAMLNSQYDNIDRGLSSSLLPQWNLFVNPRISPASLSNGHHRPDAYANGLTHYSASNYSIYEDGGHGNQSVSSSSAAATTMSPLSYRIKPTGLLRKPTNNSNSSISNGNQSAESKTNDS